MQERLRELIAAVLDLPPQEITPGMQRGEVAGWDSMSHLRLITAIEEEFGVRFTMDEIADLQTPAQLQQAIDRMKAA
mgnify:CR=1 FL=1